MTPSKMTDAELIKCVEEACSRGLQEALKVKQFPLSEYDDEELVTEMRDHRDITECFDHQHAVSLLDVADAYEALLRCNQDLAIRMLKRALFPNGGFDGIAHIVKANTHAIQMVKAA